MARKKLIAGNWKMNNSNKEALELVEQLKNLVKDVKDRDIMIAPTFTCLSDVHNAIKGTNIKLGAQNLYFEEKGAFTGQISADMLLSVGCEYVIIGHSECRDIFGEKDELINKKVKRALDKNLIPVLCVGEHLEEREKGITSDIVSGQTKEAFKGLTEAEANKVVIAYEPVWAIGTGKTATPQDADDVHKTIRETLKSLYNDSVADNMRILYGGSVNEKNADDLLNMPNIDGALVGGASLVADKFARIVNYIAK
ncbi:triose-phosphate isomerase [uncultured Brachyspira sp.]|uniref:triose-phosphate isomerase n=1 Tax=uncultured Brachyspira sp. TaxID=221953 RepID=UPI0026365A51|nr:triose-phosphate isomerase [uncultured Brachyspira sp.]